MKIKGKTHQTFFISSSTGEDTEKVEVRQSEQNLA